MYELKRFATRELNLRPEQVQIFTPTPLTAATCMYYTGIDPVTGRRVFVERSLSGKRRQKEVVVGGGTREKGEGRREKGEGKRYEGEGKRGEVRGRRDKGEGRRGENDIIRV
jgi:radical SAM superfamily enzyme YgiQ (UPF0313 family)